MNIGPSPVRRGSLHPARARVLEFLQTRSQPVGVEKLAEQFDQHPNTVRIHLDELVAAGLVIRQRTAGPGRGRPAWKYHADPDHSEPDPRVREYGALAGALAAHIATTSADPAQAGRSAGKLWGQELVDGPTDPATARRSVVELLDGFDFSPESDEADRDVTLRTCPLLDVAKRYPDVVCAVHEGMVVGALEKMAAPTDDVSLRPFALPNGCALTLARDPR